MSLTLAITFGGESKTQGLTNGNSNLKYLDSKGKIKTEDNNLPVGREYLKIMHLITYMESSLQQKNNFKKVLKYISQKIT